MGVILRNFEAGVTATDAAKKMRMSRPTLSNTSPVS